MYNCRCLTIRGKKHIRNNTTCQDASGYIISKKYSISAIADGHGSKIRSNIGSKIAVECAIDLINNDMNAYDSFLKSLQNNAESTIKSLENKICEKWMDSIFDYHLKNPFNELEFNQTSRIDTACDLFKNYGTTLLVSIISDDFGLSLQIGDGKIIWNYNSGAVEVLSDLVDVNCKDIVTTSLSDINALDEFHHKISMKGLEPIPAAITMYSDGFETENNYADTVHSASEILSKITDDKAWYNESCQTIKNKSEEYNGDDTSISLLFSDDFDIIEFYYNVHNNPFPIDLSDEYVPSEIIYKIQTDGSLTDDILSEKAIIKDKSGMKESVIISDGEIISEKYENMNSTNRAEYYEMLFNKMEFKPKPSEKSSWHMLKSINCLIDETDSINDLSKKINTLQLNILELLISNAVKYKTDLKKTLNILLNDSSFLEKISILDNKTSDYSIKIIVYDEISDKWFDKSIMNFESRRANGYGSEWIRLRKGRFENSELNGPGEEWILDRHYSGYFKNGIKSEKSEERDLKDRIIFEGTYLCDHRNNGVEYIWDGQNIYGLKKLEGTFRNNKIDGPGTEKIYKPNTPVANTIKIPADDASGWLRTYEGDFKEGVKTGTGKIFINNQ